MSPVQRNPLIEFFWDLQRWVYQISGGRLGSTLPGQLPILLLTTTGRRSGLSRTHPLGYLTVEDGYAVIASNAGEPLHPAWYHHLKTNPEATVQAGTHRVMIRAREARGEERAQLWAEVADAILPMRCTRAEPIGSSRSWSWKFRNSDTPSLFGGNPLGTYAPIRD